MYQEFTKDFDSRRWLEFEAYIAFKLDKGKGV